MSEKIDYSKGVYDAKKLGTGRMFILGVQHMFAMFGATVLVPLLTNRETIAILYGDNPESGRVPGRLDALELFINQAGIALENAFLQRKLKAG